MPFVQQAVHVPDDLGDPRWESVQKRDLEIAITLRLPFRLRFDRLVHFECDVDGPADIWFRNQLPLKAEMGPFEIMKFAGPHRDYWPIRTDAAIILHNPIISPETMESIRSKESPVVLDFSNHEQAREVVNRAIIAYSTGAEQLFAGKVLCPLSPIEFSDCMVAHVVLLGYRERRLTDQDILQILSLQPDKRMVVERGGWQGHLGDLPNIDLSRIQNLISSHEENLHHELMLLAKNLRLQEHQATGLLVAIAALETVHGAFMRHTLGQLLPNEESEKRRLINVNAG